jgi:hypothetical protein
MILQICKCFVFSAMPKREQRQSITIKNKIRKNSQRTDGSDGSDFLSTFIFQKKIMDAQIFDKLMTDRKWTLVHESTSNMLMAHDPDLSPQENQKIIDATFKAMRESYTYQRYNSIIYVKPDEIIDMLVGEFTTWFEEKTKYSYFYEDHPEIEKIINERLSRFKPDLILDVIKDFSNETKAEFLAKEVKSIMWSACLDLKKQKK